MKKRLNPKENQPSTPAAPKRKRLLGIPLLIVGCLSLVLCGWIYSLTPAYQNTVSTETAGTLTQAALPTSTATLVPTSTNPFTNTPSPASTQTRTPAKTPTQGPSLTPTLTACVTGTTLRVRSLPSPTASVIGSLAAGDCPALLGQSADQQWYYISLNGKTGWASAAYLTTVASLASLPIQTPQPNEIPWITAEPPTRSNPIDPSSPTTTSSSSSPTSAPLCDCSRDYDCKLEDFGTQKQAQACFNYCGGTISNNWSRLDGNDHDGIVCEGLP